MEPLLTRKAAADLLGVTTRFIDVQVRRKLLNTVRIGRRFTRIRPEDLRDFCEKHLETGPNKSFEPVVKE